MELYIIRHGETDWNKEKRMQGAADIPLNDYGRKLASITGDALRDIDFDIIYSSPLMRAYETATLLRGDKNTPIIKTPEITEVNFGDYEGLFFQTLLDNNDTNILNFFEKPDSYIPQGNGESFDDIIKRATSFMKTKIEPHEKDSKRIMIVAHGALNKAIMSYVKNLPIKDFWSGGLQQNCNVIILKYESGIYDIIDESRTYY